MVAIFIDESGKFTAPDGYSVVAGLALPHRALRRTRSELIRQTDGWPKEDGELKGKLLSVEHLGELVEVLFRNHGILHCAAIDVSSEDATRIAEHQTIQALKITEMIGPMTHPNFAAQVRELRRKLEAMSQQLYVQCVAQTALLYGILENVPNYYAQRRPRELEHFEWTVDAKDPARITPQEEWWKDMLGPFIQARTMRDPLPRVNDPRFNYKYFNRNRPPEAKARDVDTDKTREVDVEIGSVITRKLNFEESKDDILLQAIDVLCNFMRRVLTERVREPIALNHLGRLQILRSQTGRLQCVDLISFHDATARWSTLGETLHAMTRAARVMLVPDPTSKRKRQVRPTSRALASED